MTTTQPGRRTRPGAVLAVLCGALFLVSVDNTILNVALPSIQTSLGATTGELQWVVDAYAVLFAGLLLLAGGLGDSFGRRRMLVIGLALFAVASMGAVVASTGNQLALCRAVMGIGGAFVMPSTLSILVQTFPEPAARTRAVGIWAAVSGVGIAAGPLVGGALLEHFSWHSVFLVNPPIAVAVLVAALLLVPESRNPAAAPLDLVGALLWAAALVALVLTIITLPEHGLEGATVAYLAVLVVAGVGFVLWERHTAHPILPMGLFASRDFDVAICLVALLYFGLGGAMFFFPQFMQLVQGRSPFESGLSMVPGAALIVVCAVLSPRLGERVGSRVMVVVGLLLVTVGMAAASLFDEPTTLVYVAGSLAVVGAGMGLALPHATSAVLGSVPSEQAGVGSAVNETMGEVGSALGVAVLGALLAVQYRGAIDRAIAAAGDAVRQIPPDALDHVRESLSGARLAIPQFPAEYQEPARHIAAEAFLASQGTALLVGAGMVLVGALIAALVFPKRLTGVGGH